MAITFHCEHCGKKIEAPDSAGGKWRKCPRCHNEIYVPGLDSDEELKLAPIDEEDEAKRRELIAETYQLTQDILLEREVPNAPGGAALPAFGISDKELTKNIIMYLRQMADGELDEAQEIANKIVPCGPRAIRVLDRIALSEIPEPELADIPLQVLSGLIRNLRTRIS
jgi:phage FluMu protein Com